MRSIRTKLLGSFIAVIAVLLALSAVFITVHFVLIKQYRDITDNMIDEYRLTEVSTDLVTTFITLAKSINDPDIRARYDALRGEIVAIFSRLDKAIVNKASRVAYLGLKNTVNTLVYEIDAGIASVEAGDISVVGSTYDMALHQSYFVTENTGTLVLNELHYTELIRERIARNEFLSGVIGITLFVLITVASVLYSILFSRRLIAPLGKLTRVATSITGGNINLTVDKELITGDDEVGVLAQAFDVMIRSLRSTIRDLDIEKKGVEEKVVQRTRELREEQARFLASVNSLSLGFLLVDTRHRIILSNPVVKRMFPAGKESFDAFGKLFTPAVDETAFGDRMRSGERYELPETVLGDDYFRIIAMPVFLSSPGGGEIIGSVVIVEDVTEAKRLQQSKDAFLAIAAHEMRTPLTVIRGNAELMLDDAVIKENGGLGKQIKSVLESSVRLLGIVNDFLDIQNLETGKIALNFEPVDAADTLRTTVADLTPLAAQKGLNITLKSAGGAIPQLRLDRFRLQQIFVNLLGNAIHYTERGGITVTMKKGVRRLEILFQDTGIGINKEEQERLFQKFETGRTFLQSREYGSGLGLYISRFLAHLMGGEVSLVKSEVGVGSTFALTLPLP